MSAANNEWACARCTLLNPLTRAECSACQNPRPRQQRGYPQQGYPPPQPQQGYPPPQQQRGYPQQGYPPPQQQQDTWDCPRCTLPNPRYELQCRGCGKRRPSQQQQQQQQGGDPQPSMGDTISFLDLRHRTEQRRARASMATAGGLEGASETGEPTHLHLGDLNFSRGFIEPRFSDGRLVDSGEVTNLDTVPALNVFLHNGKFYTLNNRLRFGITAGLHQNNKNSVARCNLFDATNPFRLAEFRRKLASRPPPAEPAPTRPFGQWSREEYRVATVGVISTRDGRPYHNLRLSFRSRQYYNYSLEDGRRQHWFNIPERERDRLKSEGDAGKLRFFENVRDADSAIRRNDARQGSPTDKWSHQCRERQAVLAELPQPGCVANSQAIALQTQNVARESSQRLGGFNARVKATRQQDQQKKEANHRRMVAEREVRDEAFRIQQERQELELHWRMTGQLDDGGHNDGGHHYFYGTGGDGADDYGRGSHGGATGASAHRNPGRGAHRISNLLRAYQSDPSPANKAALVKMVGVVTRQYSPNGTKFNNDRFIEFAHRLTLEMAKSAAANVCDDEDAEQTIANIMGIVSSEAAGGCKWAEQNDVDSVREFVLRNYFGKNSSRTFDNTDWDEVWDGLTQKQKNQLYEGNTTDGEYITDGESLKQSLVDLLDERQSLLDEEKYFGADEKAIEALENEVNQEQYRLNGKLSKDRTDDFSYRK